MKASYTVRPGLTVEVEGENQAKLFAELSSAAEVFGEQSCGVCASDEIVPVARTVDKFTFYEWACTEPECGARLSLGQRKDGDGRLFPKRKLDADGKPNMENGQPGDHGGWTRYHGPGTEQEAQRPQQRTPHPAQQPAKGAGNGNVGSMPASSAPPAKVAAAQQALAQAMATGTSAAPVQPGTHTDPQSITREQWEEIRTALARHFIAPGAFLTRYGYKRPGQIPAAHFDEALAAARAPDEELRAVQKAGFGGKG
jgi:hypothetical protein